MSKKWCDGKKRCIRDSLDTLSHIKWMKSVNLGLKFSVSPKRFLPFLFSDMAAVLVIMVIASSNAALMDMALSGGAMPAEAISVLAAGVIIFGIWMIVNLWITGAIIHQSRKPKEYNESWRITFKRLPALILVLIVVSVVSFAVSLIPYAGTLLSFIIAVSFLFVNQFIILDSTGFSKSLVSSVMTFRKKVLGTIFAWLLSVVFATLIISVFTIPMFASFFLFGSEYAGEDILTSLQMYPDNVWVYACGLILMLGIAISRVFAIKYLTEVYTQFKKMKWLSF